MTRLAFLAIALLSAARAGAGAPAPALGGGGPCLRYGPDTVRLAGRLARHTFYGPPGYGENPRTDARETGYYLDLAAPVCATAGGDSATDDPRRNVRRVQLVLDSAGYARLRPFLGRRVALRGTLFPSHTGHHHAPLLLDVLKPMRVVGTR